MVDRSITKQLTSKWENNQDLAESETPFLHINYEHILFNQFVRDSLLVLHFYAFCEVMSNFSSLPVSIRRTLLYFLMNKKKPERKLNPSEQAKKVIYHEKPFDYIQTQILDNRALTIKITNVY